MDLFFVIVVLTITAYFVFRRFHNIKKLDSSSINEEVEKDFETAFERDADGNLTNHGMIELVEWYEDDLTNRGVLQSRQMQDLEDLN